MRQVTVAVAQTAPALDKTAENLNEIAKMVERICLRDKVDLVVLPELATTGYECGVRFADLAERVDGQTVDVMVNLAAKYDTHIAFGMAQKLKVESVAYSAALLVDPTGEVVSEQQKLHLKGEQRLAFRPGYRLNIGTTRFGTVGLVVGWDLAFPEVARSLALEGAELICVCGSWERPMAHEWRSFAFARAYENSVYVAACNRVGTEPTYAFCGESMVVGPRGAVLGHLEGAEPGVALATIDLDRVREVQDETQLLQSRQPRSYRGIVKMY